MVLDFDEYGKALWVVADDNRENQCVRITWNEKGTMTVITDLPPDGVDTEGWYTGSSQYCFVVFHLRFI